MAVRLLCLTATNLVPSVPRLFPPPAVRLEDELPGRQGSRAERHPCYQRPGIQAPRTTSQRFNGALGTRFRVMGKAGKPGRGNEASETAPKWEKVAPNRLTLVS